MRLFLSSDETSGERLCQSVLGLCMVECVQCEMFRYRCRAGRFAGSCRDSMILFLEIADISDVLQQGDAGNVNLCVRPE